MERITDIDQSQVDAIRAARAADAPNVDHDLDSRIDENGVEITDPSQPGGVFLDRRSRPCVAYYQAPDGSWQETALKEDDHVILVDAFPAVVIGPCSGRDYFALVSPAVFGDYSVQTMHYSVVTDRAPADPSEVPMPIYPSEPQPELMAARVGETAEQNEATKNEQKRAERQRLDDAIAHLEPDAQRKIRHYVSKHRKDTP